MTTAQIKQEKRMRRRILELIEASKASGWVRGQWIAEIVGLDDEEQAAGLLADLVNLGLAETHDTRELRAQIPGLRFADYHITAKGTRLLAGLEPVEPLIEDERL